MEPDEERLIEMQLLLEQSPEGDYSGLLRLLEAGELSSFKALVHRALSRQPASVDVNRLIPYPVNKRLLDKALLENRPDFVEFLLEVGADPNLLNEEDKRAPVHFAAEAGNDEALAALLKHPNIQPNLKAAGLTALHLAVRGSNEESARLLLLAGASANIPNNQGLTALHMAADRTNRALVQLILEHASVLDLDSYRDRKRETARSLIEKKFPDIGLPPAVGPEPAALLHYYLLANDEDNFLRTLGQLREPPGDRAELLRLAVERNLLRASRQLLDLGALDPAAALGLGVAAVQRAHPELLLELLERSPGLAGRLLLPASQELAAPSGPGPGRRQARLRCFEAVLRREGVEVRQADDKGNTPLHYAARAECDEAVEMLLRRGSCLGQANRFGAPALGHLSAPALERRLDECLASRNERTEELEILFDYRNLVPHEVGCADAEDFPSRGGRACSETEALLYIAEHKQLAPLLKHPLLASFLYLKFLRIRHLLYANFFLYCVFYVTLLLFIRDVTKDLPEKEGAEPLQQERKSLTLYAAFLSVGLGYMILREVLQFLSSPLHYLASTDNWLELTLIGLAIALLCGAGAEVAAVAILLSTWEFIILVSQHPVMAVKIEMFKTVTLSIIKYMIFFVFPILAFAWAFSVLFQGNDNFPDPARAFFKTIIMLTGELDSGDLPFSNFPLISRLVFVGFIILIVISLLNLLTGLAVSDTQQILDEAELVCLISRAKLIAYAEKIALGSPFVPSSRLSCCVNRLPFSSLTSIPLRPVARRIMLFPQYLPRAKIAVMAHKNYAIELIGRKSKKRKFSFTRLKMDSRIVQRAKEIIKERNSQSPEDNILAQLQSLREALDRRLGAIEEALQINSTTVT